MFSGLIATYCRHSRTTPGLLCPAQSSWRSSESIPFFHLHAEVSMQVFTFYINLHLPTVFLLCLWCFLFSSLVSKFRTFWNLQFSLWSHCGGINSAGERFGVRNARLQPGKNCLTSQTERRRAVGRSGDEKILRFETWDVQTWSHGWLFWQLQHRANMGQGSPLVTSFTQLYPNPTLPGRWSYLWHRQTLTATPAQLGSHQTSKAVAAKAGS